MPRIRLDANTAMTIAAVIISLCALFVSFAEVRIMRSQQKANLYPYLTVGQHYNGDGFGFYLENKGIGPARINSFQVFEDGKYYNDWVTLVNTYLPDTLALGWESMRMHNIQHTIIAPGEEVELVFAKWNEASRFLETQIRGIQFRLCYASLLDDHWLLDSYGTPQELSESCERQEGDEMF